MCVCVCARVCSCGCVCVGVGVFMWVIMCVWVRVSEREGVARKLGERVCAFIGDDIVRCMWEHLGACACWCVSVRERESVPP